jgi:hypothetical protein
VPARKPGRIPSLPLVTGPLLVNLGSPHACCTDISKADTSLLGHEAALNQIEAEAARMCIGLGVPHP